MRDELRSGKRAEVQSSHPPPEFCGRCAYLRRDRDAAVLALRVLTGVAVVASVAITVITWGWL